MASPDFWIINLLSCITAALSVLILSRFPKSLSPVLSDLKKPTHWEIILFSLILILIFQGIGKVEHQWPIRIAYSLFFLVLMICTWTDLHSKIIPNRIILFGIVVWLIFFMTFDFLLIESILAATVLAIGIICLNQVCRVFYGEEAFGMGDVKLIYFIGLFTGWEALWLLYLAIFTGAIAALSVVYSGKADRSTRLPFAPFLTVGSIIGIFLIPSSILWSWFYGA